MTFLNINVLLTRPISFHRSDICSGCPQNNEWGSDYWLAHCLKEKQTILEPVTDDKNIEFPTSSMVIKGEYLTLAAQQKRKGGYVIRIIDQELLYTTSPT